MSTQRIFDNPEFGSIRTLETHDGEFLFCGSDVAKALGYVKPENAISAHCKGVTEIVTPTKGGKQKMKFIKKKNSPKLEG